MGTGKAHYSILDRLDALRGDARAKGFESGSPLDVALLEETIALLGGERPADVDRDAPPVDAQRRLIRMWLEGSTPLPNGARARATRLRQTA